ncbi:hypothetical protein TIFTF001_033254 [Ficus carica]|uniref:Uncharacterized protein n=1 Tax=Ficus carica TaxID=3494 RepID=A0AA88DY11_FICCA|nr:hypothetical protein TIFTF001_033254 [Ficus carica]
MRSRFSSSTSASFTIARFGWRFDLSLDVTISESSVRSPLQYLSEDVDLHRVIRRHRSVTISCNGSDRDDHIFFGNRLAILSGSNGRTS